MEIDRSEAYKLDLPCYLNIDMVDHEAEGDGNNPVSPDGVLSQAAYDQIRKHNLQHLIWRRYGPGGGNPDVRLYGTEENLLAYITECYGDAVGANGASMPGEYEAFVASNIKQSV